MALVAYAYRIGMEVALLDEAAWNVIEPFLADRSSKIFHYSVTQGCSIYDAREREPSGLAALDKYREMTGILLDHPEQLLGVRMSDYGALCPECAKPFRTPNAKVCAACGYELPGRTVAGPLTHPLR